MARIVRVFAPGRTELAGNHTDHQGGRVIAAAVTSGITMEVCARSDAIIYVESAGFVPFKLEVLDSVPRDDERFTTAALVRGVVVGLRAAGVNIDGFNVRAKTSITTGGGLSSSAAFELALVRALCELAHIEGAFSESTSSESAHAEITNAKRLSAKEPNLVALAKIGQVAERDYFGKACGLMDQLAVALGGIVAIDFFGEDSGGEPRIQRINFDFEQHGYTLCLINTHCDHSLYTQDYSQVARDMNDIAAFLGMHVLSQVPEERFFDHFEEIRASFGDLPAMRGLHYYHECRLVDARAQAMLKGDINAFLHYTRQSSASSAQYLQNVSTFNRMNQPAMVALALADRLLEGKGACRIHGGGFGGSVQAFVPSDYVESFARKIDAHLGAGSCQVQKLNKNGVVIQG